MLHGIADVIGCQHPLYAWALLACVFSAQSVCSSSRVIQLMNCVLIEHTQDVWLCLEKPFLVSLKQTHKGAPQWTTGVWLGKTLSNDVHIIAIPGAQQLFVTRSVKRLPASKAWNGEMIGGVEACPWQFSYASLGSQFVRAKRIVPPTPSPLASAPVRDFDAEAVVNLPPTPDEREHVPRLVVPPQGAVLVGDTADDENMGRVS